MLLPANLLRPAISQYYYAAFHAAVAALLSRGLEPRTRSGVKTEFSRVFLHGGLLPPSLGTALRHLEDDREAADYAREAVFTRQDADEARVGAAALRDAVRALLLREGWTAP